MQPGDILINQKQFNKQLPDKYELEKDVKVGSDIKINKTDELFAVAIVNKNGSRRLANADSENIVEALQDYTGLRWEADGVSNFVFHLIDTQKIKSRR